MWQRKLLHWKYVTCSVMIRETPDGLIRVRHGVHVSPVKVILIRVVFLVLVVESVVFTVNYYR